MTAVPNLHDLTAADQTPPALFARTEADLTVFMDRAKPIIEAVRRRRVVRHFAGRIIAAQAA